MVSTVKLNTAFLVFFPFFLIACQSPSGLTPRSSPVPQVDEPVVFSERPYSQEQKEKAEILADRIVVQEQAIGVRQAPLVKNPEASDKKQAFPPEQEVQKSLREELFLQPQSVYQKALSLLLTGNILVAREKFLFFQDTWPKDKLMPNVLYWLGETYYAQGEYSLAVLTFKKVWERYPKHVKAPDAMLKAGYSYIGLQNMETARFYLQTVIQKYPRSGSALLAQKKIQTF